MNAASASPVSVAVSTGQARRSSAARGAAGFGQAVPERLHLFLADDEHGCYAFAFSHTAQNGVPFRPASSSTAAC
jgi:hypothetical protein